MHKFMAAIGFVSRKNIITAAIVLACGLAGAAWGWYSSMSAAGEMARELTRKLPQQDAVFVLPPRPPVVSDPSENEDPADLAELRIWEITARQPLPPRKEPLTAPRWKIVGVTTVGDDTEVLILFDKQTITETRRVGDLLPGGAKIVQISQDELRIILNGQTMKLSIRKQ